MDSRTSALEGRLDSFIGDIESRDSPIGPVLRSVYEDDGQGVFLHKLQQHSNHHEKEIERMCNFHYQVPLVHIFVVGKVHTCFIRKNRDSRVAQCAQRWN